MADTTTHVSTPTELCESADFAIGFGDEASGTHTIILDNDIDFNNEDYYYHKDNFMFFKTDVGGRQKTKIINMNNKTISNVFVYGGFSFIYSDMTYTSQPIYKDSYRNVTFKDGTFEVVLNGGSFLNMVSASYNGATNTEYTFRNCTFNIKTISFEIMFYISGIIRYCNFINCTFNLDLINGQASSKIIEMQTPTSSLSIYQLLSIESCQFKIRIHNSTIFSKKSTSPYSSIIFMYNPNSGSVSNNISFNNNILFIDNLTSSTNMEILLIIKSQFPSTSYNVSTLNNNFIAGLFNGNPITIQGLWVSSGTPLTTGSFFYDSEKVTVSSSSSYTKYALTTAECKDAAALAAAGYSLANDAE